MSSRSEGKGGGRGFLSAHRCPEVDLLPQRDTNTQTLPPCSVGPAELTCTGKCEAEYLDICSAHHSKEEGEEEEEGSISDWSEEDLSLHFSPSVIHSDDEESDSESGFECVDVAVETQVTGTEGEGLKMVPKRQIQLKKKKKSIEKPQVSNEPAEGGEVNSNVSANELLCSVVRHRPDLLLRQHSMPASFHTRSTTDGDVDSSRFHRGLIAGASPGLLVGGNPRYLQKSFSLDETKTKMASCLIKNVLWKKMQVEHTSHLRRRPSPIPPPPAEQQRTGGGGVSKAPVHLVRDMRSFVKHSYSLSFPMATTTPDDNRPASFKVIGRDNSPPPTYQQAVGVKGQVAKVTASLNKSQNRKHSDAFISTPISRGKGDDVTQPVVSLDPPTIPPVCHDLSKFSQSQRAMTSLPLRGTQAPPPAQEHGSSLDVSSPSVPGSSQHPCFCPAPLQPHLGKVGYTHLRLPPPAAPLHLLSRSDENQTRFTGVLEGHGGPGTLLQPPPLLCSARGFLPAQAGGDNFVDITGSAAAPASLFSGPALCPLMLDPVSGRCFYVETPPQPQRKLLLDPETGQFVQVFLPAAGSTSNTTMFHRANPTPTVRNPTPAVLHVGGAYPSVLSVMQLQQPVGVSSLYGPAYLPVTMMTSHMQHIDDITHMQPTDDITHIDT